MFVIFNKTSTCVKIVSTENPVEGLSLKDNWEDNYEMIEFTDESIESYPANFLQVINGELINQGTFEEVENNPILRDACLQASPDIFE